MNGANTRRGWKNVLGGAGPAWLPAIAAILVLGCAKEKPKGSEIGVVDGRDGAGGAILSAGTGGAFLAVGGSTSRSGGATGADDSGLSAAGSTSGPEVMVSACGDSIQGLGECGAQAVTASVRRPHMLIVMDKSGSTVDQPAGFDVTIWEGMKAALGAALDQAKSSVWFGLELYPFSNVPIPPTCRDRCCEMPADAEMNVPIEEGTTAVPKIMAALNATAPGGGTPTAVALRRAYEYYTVGGGAALEGEKFVLLATDGGPNCNQDLQCAADGCTTNLEGQCTLDGNCCEGSGGSLSCVDDQATITQIQALRDAGIGTFVVGIPGSEAYASYLEQFAVTGDQINPDGPPSYYRVDAAGGVEGLTSVFSAITTQLVTSCEIQLDQFPRDTEQVNVAVDCDIVPRSGSDGTDGWVLDVTSSPSTITLQGTLCRWVEQRGAERVDIVFGCPTVR